MFDFRRQTDAWTDKDKDKEQKTKTNRKEFKMILRKSNTVAKTENNDDNQNLPVEKDSGQFQIMTMDVNHITDILQENMGADELTAFDLTRIKVPGGGGTTWRVDTIEGEIEMKEIIGILVTTQTTNTYWKEEFTGGGTPPDCFSEDGITGRGNPGGDCKSCPLFEFGSDENKRGKACKQNRMLYVVTQNEILPLAIKAPATSLRNTKKYLLGLVSKNRAMYSVYTKFTLERDKNKDGIEYSKILLSKVGDVENVELIKSYAKAIKPYLVKATRALGQEQNG